MSSNSSPEWTTLAHLLRPQGRKGEILADLHTDLLDHFAEHPDVFLAPPGFSGSPADARPAVVAAFWSPSGKNQGRIVLHFTGVDSISAAELLAGLDVLIPTSERLALDDGAEYVADLVGCHVFDGSESIGVLDSVQFSTDAGGRRLPDVAPLLTVVTTGGDEVLIPFVQSFITSLDLPARRIVMSLPPGLVELNRPGAST